MRDEVRVKRQLELLRDIGVRIMTRNSLKGDFLIGSLMGGLQVAPERETERIDTIFKTSRIIPRYKKFMEIETFSSPYRSSTDIAPCRYIFSELKLTEAERINEMERTKKHFPICSRSSWYIHPTLKDLRDTFQGDTRAYLAPKALIEATGILE